MPEPVIWSHPEDGNLTYINKWTGRDATPRHAPSPRPDPDQLADWSAPHSCLPSLFPALLRLYNPLACQVRMVAYLSTCVLISLVPLIVFLHSGAIGYMCSRRLQSAWTLMQWSCPMIILYNLFLTCVCVCVVAAGHNHSHGSRLGHAQGHPQPLPGHLDDHDHDHHDHDDDRPVTAAPLAAALQVAEALASRIARWVVRGATARRRHAYKRDSLSVKRRAPVMWLLNNKWTRSNS